MKQIIVLICTDFISITFLHDLYLINTRRKTQNRSDDIWDIRRSNVHPHFEYNSVSKISWKIYGQYDICNLNTTLQSLSQQAAITTATAQVSFSAQNRHSVYVLLVLHSPKFFVTFFFFVNVCRSQWLALQESNQWTCHQIWQVI